MLLAFRFVFKSFHFISGMTLPTTQQNLLFPQSSSKHCCRTFFTKNYRMSCKLLPNCAQLRNALYTSRRSNFYSTSKTFFRDSPRKLPFFGFIKKKFYPKLFVEYFYRNIHNLGIKLFYQNGGHSIVLYYLDHTIFL